ncbi:stachyose synthase [Trifolium pratense]|uniref:Stachyose synthase n=1 Tax=Trifolium pratense TaxID=57577 RepID=A0A2K3L2W2_TRIPR|nr:stachyose synthase [Trifolium pratense]
MALPPIVPWNFLSVSSTPLPAPTATGLAKSFSQILSYIETPYTARDLVAKLGAIWKCFQPWQLISLGRGFYDFKFECPEDQRKAWSVGAYNLRPGLLRLSKWVADFNPRTQKQTYVQVWIRIIDLPQEYWRPRTLFEIASAIGTPLILVETTEK